MITYSVLGETQRVLVNGVYEMRVAVDHPAEWSVYTEDENGLTVLGKVDALLPVELDADPHVRVISIAEVFEESGGEE